MAKSEAVTVEAVGVGCEAEARALAAAFLRARGPLDGEVEVLSVGAADSAVVFGAEVWRPVCRVRGRVVFSPVSPAALAALRESAS